MALRKWQLELQRLETENHQKELADAQKARDTLECQAFESYKQSQVILHTTEGQLTQKKKTFLNIHDQLAAQDTKASETPAAISTYAKHFREYHNEQKSLSVNKENLYLARSLHLQRQKTNAELFILEKNKNRVKNAVKDFKNCSAPHSPIFGRTLKRKNIVEHFSQVSLATHAPVTIRNIFFHQVRVSKSPFGEFNLTVLKNPPYSKQLENESEKDTIKRIMDDVTETGDFANSIHRQKNFETSENKQLSPKVKLGKENHITRMGSSEGRFYPYRKPISINGVKELECRIRDKARHWLPNLHLCIATFPVIDEHKSVYNVALYVQCGPEPKITKITKAVPHFEDPLFLNTRNPYFCEGSDGEILARRIEKQCSTLLNTLSNPEYNNLDIEIKNFEELLQSNSDYPPSPELLQTLKEIKDVVAKQTFDLNVLESLGDQLIKRVEKHCIKIRERDRFLIGKIEEELAKATLNTIDRPIPGLDGEYSRVIDCTSMGGAHFATVLDICLDHYYQVGKYAFKLKMNAMAQGNYHYTFSQISHLVTSASVEPEEESALSFLEQVDTYSTYTGIQQYKPQEKKFELLPSKKVLQMETTNFGGAVEVVFTKPIQLKPLPTEFKVNLDFRDEIMEAVLILHELRDKDPVLAPIYNKCLLLFVLNRCIEEVLVAPNLNEVKGANLLLEKLMETKKELQDKKLDPQTCEPLFKALTSVSPSHSFLNFVTTMTKTVLENELKEQEVKSCSFHSIR